MFVCWNFCPFWAHFLGYHNRSFDIFLTWTCQSKFCFHQTTVLYIYYQKIIFVSIDCQSTLFKSTCSKTSYLTPCNVPDEWFVFLHLVLLADWVDYIFPTSKCWYVFSISKYSKIKSFKNVKIFRAGGSMHGPLLHFICTWNWYENLWRNDAYNRNTNRATLSMTSWFMK